MRNKPRDVAAVVVSYRPAPSLIRNLRSLAAQLSAVFVIDNTPGSGCERLFRIARQYPSVRVVRLGVNTGIGAALNIGMQLAREEGFSWVITLDQDSFLPLGSVARLRRAASSANTAIVVPAIRDAYTQALILHKIGGRASRGHQVAITSGNLLRIKAWESVDGFDWQLFIDMVDFDFCLRLARRGWTLRLDDRTELLHRWGQVRRVSLFKSHMLTLRVYSLLRRYFQARNSITLLRRHAAFATLWCLGHVLGLFLVSLKIHLLEKGSRKAWRLGLIAGWSKPEYVIRPVDAAGMGTRLSPRAKRRLDLRRLDPRRLGRDYKKRLDDLSTFPLL